MARERAGRKARCSSCLAQLTVPYATGQPVEAGLPPRKVTRRQEGPVKPKLSKANPDGRKYSDSRQAEMHPLLVILIAGLLFLNGWKALDFLIYAPFSMSIHSVMSQSIDDLSDEEIAELGTTREKLTTTWFRVLAGGIVLGIGHLALAASMAGILLWRGYAVYYAVVVSIGLFVIDSVFVRQFSAVGSLNVSAVVTMILLLKYMPPAAWPRLMNQRRVIA
ncbi:MAG: hypothetical protein R3C19_22675 [Planctomycetaceae bacterium]